MLKPLSELVAEAKRHCTCLSLEEAEQWVRETPGVLLVDVREPAEHAAGAIQGFINIPRGVLEMKLPELCPHPDHPILLHCATGGRAALSAAALKAMGYRQVHIIDAPFDVLQARWGKADDSQG
ncbi:rhodanese-like domain-containing protein [Hahella sp. SMD15-11]|uniref:Rhodanese-like domain-containing protein n=1 Tax=Thermohahella caldifontis TaxID=3142973 RepID=A0AB39USA6_9GAMM